MKTFYKTEDLIIRSMIESDVDQIELKYKHEGWYFNRSVFETYLLEQEKKERIVFIAEYKEKVAGYVTLVPVATVGPYKDLKVPEIVNFGVFTEYRNKGIGSKLMDVIESVANETNHAVTLSVGVHSGYGSAQRMYVKRGFIPDGSGVWFNDRNHEQYADCINNDDLVLYMMKTFN